MKKQREQLTWEKYELVICREVKGGVEPLFGNWRSSQVLYFNFLCRVWILQELPNF